jgi:hypothetical protein
MIEELFRPRREENGIPLLTEIILEPSISAAPASDQLQAQPSAESAPPSHVPAEQWTEQLTERLTQHVQSILDSALEHRLNETMREVLEQSIPAVRAELQRTLTDTAKEVISHAIHQEFAKITAPNNIPCNSYDTTY